MIGQAELAPVTVSMRIWAAALSKRNVIIFIDNDSAREALIRGYSPALASAELISVTWLAIAQARCAAWFARVPAPSNIGDGPNRVRFEQAAKVGVKHMGLPSGWPEWLVWEAGPEQESRGAGGLRSRPRTDVT